MDLVDIDLLQFGISGQSVFADDCFCGNFIVLRIHPADEFVSFNERAFRKCSDGVACGYESVGVFTVIDHEGYTDLISVYCVDVHIFCNFCSFCNIGAVLVNPLHEVFAFMCRSFWESTDCDCLGSLVVCAGIQSCCIFSASVEVNCIEACFKFCGYVHVCTDNGFCADLCACIEPAGECAAALRRSCRKCSYCMTVFNSSFIDLFVTVHEYDCMHDCFRFVVQRCFFVILFTVLFFRCEDCCEAVVVCQGVCVCFKADCLVSGVFSVVPRPHGECISIIGDRCDCRQFVRCFDCLGEASG